MKVEEGELRFGTEIHRIYSVHPQYTVCLYTMCALNIQIRDIYFGWLVVFVFFVSIVSEKSLADRRRAGRPINPFMTMIRFSLRFMWKRKNSFYIYFFCVINRFTTQKLSMGTPLTLPASLANNSTVLGGGDGVSTYIDVLIFM